MQPMVGLYSPVQHREMILPPRVREISQKVKLIRFGIIQDVTPGPWQRLAGMFRLDHPVKIEEMLDAKGFEDAAGYI